MAKKKPLAKLRMLYARSLGCTWVYHILCNQKNKSCGSSYPTHMGCVKNDGPRSQRTHVLMNDDFHPTHQQRPPNFHKKTHINFQTFSTGFSQNPHGTSTFSLRLASPIASASTAAASAAAVALRSAARCADTAPSPGRCGSEPDRRRSGRAPGVHHGHHGFG